MSQPPYRRSDPQAAVQQRARSKSPAPYPPAAPYPPFAVPATDQANSKQVLRSSLSSSPHYSQYQRSLSQQQQQQQQSKNPGGGGPIDNSGHGRQQSRLTHSDRGGTPELEDVRRKERSQSFGEPDRKSPKATTVGASAAAARRTSHPTRLEFCPLRHDFYACINCLPPVPPLEQDRKQEEVATFREGSAAPIPAKHSVHSHPKKLGPILLELRRLDLIDNLSRRKQSKQLFSSSTVGISRGNPQLGTSVASTCLSFRPSGAGLDDDSLSELLCATGLTTGALCLHSFQTEDQSQWTSSVEYFTPRHHRMASSVAWRPRDTQHVAIGLVGGPGGTGGMTGGRQRVTGSRTGGGGDREFCCLVWDVEAQANPSLKGATMTPVFKLAHNAGVASLAWLMEGQTLAVGCQQRTVQLYDLRVKGTNYPPVSTWAHSESVNGIEVDPHRPQVFATFGQTAGEPVKLWDARRMDSSLGEIKTSPYGPKSDSGDNQNGGVCPVVSVVRWSHLHPGCLSVGIGDSIQHFDTTSAGSRPVLTRVSYAPNSISDLAFQTKPKIPTIRRGNQADKESEEAINASPGGYNSASELLSLRMLTVLSDGSVRDMPKFSTGALAISRRDGRVAHTLGRTFWVGSTSKGPTAIESLQFRTGEDISATMMRRARCLHVARYSMDATSNIQMLAEEQSFGNAETSMSSQPHREELLRLWSWVERVESLCLDDFDVSDKGNIWPAKGLIDAGVWRLLRFDISSEDSDHLSDVTTYSDSLSCNTYDSPARRFALIACGWTGRMHALNDVIAECEALCEFERSAALAVWHSDIGAAVDALQRGADAVRFHSDGTSQTASGSVSLRYAETLQLAAMCIAGYSGSGSGSSSVVWRKACSSLLEREDFNDGESQKTRIAYLRSICTFLINIGLDGGLDKVLYDKRLSLCDRVAFACRFLERSELKSYLTNCIKRCNDSGYLEGLVITGINKRGIEILQSYLDQTGDVQSTALISSRVILPIDWVSERLICSEWLDSYRTLLNTWQMWQSRAMFDVDRAELLRRLKGKQAEEMLGQSNRGGYYPGRRGHNPGRGRQPPAPKQREPEICLPAIPAQLDARCNYCSTSLSGLRRQEGIANQWLSRLKPVLNCCPQCRKPLPRCAICLLSLGCLNPYMELKRERGRGPRIGAGLTPADDLSSLANLPFAEWFTWCMRCKHGGHAHHIVGWFAEHDVCPVSGCDCNCQFDGIKKLNRPALNKQTLDMNQEPTT